jgi:hypothetical protein
MKYRVTVLASYWQAIEVEAVSKDFAEVLALDAFDINQARFSESEIVDTRLVEGETK